MAAVATGRGATAPAAVEATPATGAPKPAPVASGTRKEQFASAADSSSNLDVGGLVLPMSPKMVLAGSVIAATLITGLDAD